MSNQAQTQSNQDKAQQQSQPQQTGFTLSFLAKGAVVGEGDSKYNVSEDTFYMVDKAVIPADDSRFKPENKQFGLYNLRGWSSKTLSDIYSRQELADIAEMANAGLDPKDQYRAQDLEKFTCGSLVGETASGHFKVRFQSPSSHHKQGSALDYVGV